MSQIMIIKIARDFSQFPAGRFKKDGPASGEAFRDDMLIPALEQYDQVIVDLDGVLGYGSSFLEEAFGGLLRVMWKSDRSIQNKLSIVGGMEYDRLLIEEWMEDQHMRNQKCAEKILSYF